LSALVESSIPALLEEADVAQSGLVIDRDRSPFTGGALAGSRVRIGERAARNALRRQIDRLERECSAIVADAFPRISPAEIAEVNGGAVNGPCLLTLEELERTRDRLAGGAQDLRRLAAARVEHERSSRELLERIKLEPGSYKFARLPVRDLGQGGCGVWEVRPRLGLIGMLAGWWHVKLSSGCPLAKGPRTARPRTPRRLRATARGPVLLTD
jgi:hypothetical protein